MGIDDALARLNSQLPLKARQDRLPVELKHLHQWVLRFLSSHGRVPYPTELKAEWGEMDIASALQRLAADDLVVLDAKGEHLVGAYPLTSEVTPHRISLNGRSLYAMCALDAVAVAPLFDSEVKIASTCHVTKTPIQILMRASEVIDVRPTADVIVGIRWQMPTAVAAYSMCLQMVFLKDSHVARDWQQNDADNISLFALPDAVAFGKAFFRPLLE